MDDDQPSWTGPDDIPFAEHAKRLRHRFARGADRRREVALGQSGADRDAFVGVHPLLPR